jgi:hypothetical protein
VKTRRQPVKGTSRFLQGRLWRCIPRFDRLEIDSGVGESLVVGSSEVSVGQWDLLEQRQTHARSNDAGSRARE